MSNFKLPTYPKKFTHNEIHAARHALAIQGGEASAAQQRVRIASIKKELKQYIILFLDEWVNQANLAITRAARPIDNKSHRSWFIALIGNLVWAGTVFIPGGGLATSIIGVLSFAGATVGSGTVPEFEGAPSEPADPKEMVTKRIHESYPKVESWFISESEVWAWEIDSQAQAGNPIPENNMNEFVWVKMFPNIGYKTRHNAIYTSVKSNMESMLADYNLQWRTWLSKNGLDKMTEDAKWFKYMLYRGDPFRANLDKHWRNFAKTST